MNDKYKYEAPSLRVIKPADAIGKITAAATEGEASATSMLSVISHFEVPERTISFNAPSVDRAEAHDGCKKACPEPPPAKEQ